MLEPPYKAEEIPRPVLSLVLVLRPVLSLTDLVELFLSLEGCLPFGIISSLSLGYLLQYFW